MKLKTLFCLTLILFSSLVLVPLINAGECVELKYDEGPDVGAQGDPTGYQYGVRFSLPNKWETAQLVTARFYILRSPSGFEVHVYDLYNNELVQPFTVTPTSTGWFDVPLDVKVSGDFYVVIEWLEDYKPDIGVNSLTPASGRTVSRDSSSSSWTVQNYNIVIRAVVCKIPVGGELLPNNVSIIGTGILAVASIFGISAGIAYKKRKII